MKLLVGPVSAAEAELLFATEVQILDVKNVTEGSYGGASPSLIRAVEQLARPCGKTVSATLGDLSCQPGTAGLAAHGAAAAGATMLKVGLFGPRTVLSATAILRAVVAGARSALTGRDSLVFAGGYADYRRIDGMTPLEIVEAATASGADGVMLDTHDKNGGSLFEVLDHQTLSTFLRRARSAGLKTVLAGSLGPQHLPVLWELKPDVIGIRGSACFDGDRRLGLDIARVQTWLAALGGDKRQAAAT